MKKITSLLLIPLLFLMGCVSMQESIIKKEQVISFAKGVSLNTESLFPLPFQGTFLQQIKVALKDKNYQFSVHLTLSPDRLKAIAFNDIAGQLYELTWTKDTLVWSASNYFPKHLDPKNILGDFLLAHLPIDILKKHIKGATVKEQNNIRSLVVGDLVIRQIVSSFPLKGLWKIITLKNNVLGYQLDIQTVALS